MILQGLAMLNESQVPAEYVLLGGDEKFGKVLSDHLIRLIT